MVLAAVLPPAATGLRFSFGVASLRPVFGVRRVGDVKGGNIDGEASGGRILRSQRPLAA